MTSGPDEDDTVEYRYLTIGELGGGGMGTVWEMHDTALNRPIALKQLHPDLKGDQIMESHFVKEARILAKLEHPGIVPIHEFNFLPEDGSFYYTMEKIRGESLQSILDGLRNRNKAILRRWTLRKLIDAFSRLCETVAYAHKRGILHRDLKPENIMLGRYGEVFLVDWGIAKEIALDHKDEEEPTPARQASSKPDYRVQQTFLENGQTKLFTLAGNVFGTPSYMSPEAAKGLDPYTNGGSDIFALGAILYQILALRPPYVGRDPDHILEKAKRGRIKPVSLAVGRGMAHLPDKKAPDALAAIAMKALSPERRHRYRTAQEMRRDVEAYLQGRPPKAQAPGPWELFISFTRRNPGPSMVGALALCATVAIIINGLIENLQFRRTGEQTRHVVAEKKKELQRLQDETISVKKARARRLANRAAEQVNIAQIKSAKQLAAGAVEIGADDETLSLCREILELPEEPGNHPELAAQFEGKDQFAPALFYRSSPGFDYEKAAEYLETKWSTYLWTLTPSIAGEEEKVTGCHLTLRGGIPPEELDFIRGWPIDHLTLQGIALTDFSVLLSLPRLSKLTLEEGHQVRDLSGIENLSRLTALNVGILVDSPETVFDLSPLAKLGSLRSLDFEPPVTSLAPLRDLKLTHLNIGPLALDSSLSHLSRMPLQSLGIHGATDFEALRNMPLHRFKADTYSPKTIEVIQDLPITHLHGEFDWARDERFRQFPLEHLETGQFHPISIWKDLKSITLKGNGHDLSGIEETKITHLHLAAEDNVSSIHSRPILHPLLSATQLKVVTLDTPVAGGHPDYHVHLETPFLTTCLISDDLFGARTEFRRLKSLYLEHPALKDIVEGWLHVLERHIDEAVFKTGNHTWQPKLSFLDHTYQWFKTPVPWREARMIAQQLGGKLMTIDSKEEWTWLESEFGIPRHENQVWSGGTNRIWIGGTKPGVCQILEVESGNVPSIYLQNGKLVNESCSDLAAWSFIIEWEGGMTEE